jgi:nucleotide-binding universal stress UspA family protein
VFKNILVATDFSNASRSALDEAITLAKTFDSKLKVIHIVSIVDAIYNSERFLIPADWRSEMTKRLDDFFPSSLYPGSKEFVIGSSTSEAILNHARMGNFDLIVVGNHARGAISRLFVGSVAQRLAENSEIPLMVVSADESEEKYRSYHRILVPTDFSDSSGKAIELAVRLTNFLNAEFYLIHVVDTLTLSDLSAVYPFVKINEPQNAVPSLNETMRLLIGKEKPASEKIETLWGSPAEEILEYVRRERIDLIVMGTHGKKALNRFLLGSVTAGIVAKSPVPVITVSTPHNFHL